MTTYLTLVPMTWQPGVTFAIGTEVEVVREAEPDFPGRLQPVGDPGCEMNYWPREIAPLTIRE